MSTLDGPIWSRCSIALTGPARSHFKRIQSRERWSQSLGERYCSSREGKIKETKKGKRRAGEKRKHATNFKDAECCPSAVVHGTA